MSCPPGKVLNPRTLRCVTITGRKAQELVKHGDIAAGYYAQPVHPYFGRSVRKTVRQPRVPSLAEAFGAAPVYRKGPTKTLLYAPANCPPGQERNPATRRCIKLSGKTYKRLHPAVAVADQERRVSSNGPITIPIGSAAAAPLLDRNTVLGWTREQCKNNRDPITGVPFASAETAALQDLIRLHDRTCVMASQMNEKVAAEHKAGHLATIPGTSDNMTMDDFRVLRDSMRRHNPGYKLPGRKHQPPPSNWQLYIGSDNRSGPSFASVLYIDVNKVVQGPAGPEYPLDSVKLDLGFIPTDITGTLCAPQMVIDLVQRLAAANRLLTPVAGGWKPVAGFPFTKHHWSGADVRQRFSKLCQDLTRALTTPL